MSMELFSCFSYSSSACFMSAKAWEEKNVCLVSRMNLHPALLDFVGVNVKLS